jgi:hypothetical protein
MLKVSLLAILQSALLLSVIRSFGKWPKLRCANRSTQRLTEAVELFLAFRMAEKLPVLPASQFSNEMWHLLRTISKRDGMSAALRHARLIAWHVMQGENPFAESVATFTAVAWVIEVEPDDPNTFRQSLTTAYMITATP